MRETALHLGCECQCRRYHITIDDFLKQVSPRAILSPSGTWGTRLSDRFTGGGPAAVKLLK